MRTLSTKGRYGARLMLELALEYGNGAVFLKDIAERQRISLGYLEHIVPDLKSAGLIESTRGAHGGYRLARTPGAITLGDVVRAVEGPLALADCVVRPDVCSRSEKCVTGDIWRGISKVIEDAFDGVTLAEMARRQQKLAGAKKPGAFRVAAMTMRKK